MSEDTTPTASATPPSPQRRVVEIVDNSVNSKMLFTTTRELFIRHGDEQYRLRLTAQNKLILTK